MEEEKQKLDDASSPMEIYKIKRSVFWKTILFEISIVIVWFIFFMAGLIVVLTFDLSPHLFLVLFAIVAAGVSLLYWGRFKSGLFLNIYRSVEPSERYLLKKYIARKGIVLTEKQSFLKWFEKIPRSKEIELKKTVSEVLRAQKSVKSQPYEPRKLNEKTEKVLLYGSLVALVLGIICLGIYSSISLQNSRDTIAEYGTEVECRVIYKYASGKNNREIYIFFDFNHNDSLVKLKSMAFDFNWRDFERAIIGMKYKALVILEGKDKYEYSLLLLDKPILSSYSNVYKEREDIISKYKVAKDFIKEYGKEGKELDKIWEKYYK